MFDKVNLDEAFARFDESWKPRIVGELDGSYVKVVKFKGEFVWHRHAREDELFLVVRGGFTLRLRDRDISLRAGELVIVPRTVEHMPVADEEAHVLLIERTSTVNTGDAQGPRTVDPAWI